MKDILKDRRKFWGVFCIAATALLLIGWFIMPLKYDFWLLLLTVLLAAAITQFALYKIWPGVTVCAAIIYIINQQVLGLPFIMWWVLIFAAILLGVGIMLLQKKIYTADTGSQMVGVINSDGIATDETKIEKNIALTK